ncbi:NHL repeat-containing protein [Luteimonas sp. MC1828]|uniref:NHL repeat-containing protein n=1 Tax=Luteimonas sp. MC1828 TaxID=2799787 RepID=UPI0018F18D3B|nr:NHL repeat-containing protein [Luteimonas sp. MC1828]MBJ7575656.1 hypothetical protein [Luteimonas sp. MC1828]
MNRLLPAWFALVVSVASSGVAAQNIGNHAGNGEQGFSGDDGPAVQAQVDRPQGVALDGDGSVVIADTWNHRIRRIDSQGIITTIAGNGVAGFSGDGGPATSASLNRPTELAIDAAGNIYVADRNNSRVRRIAANGTITTFAGNGNFGFGGDNGPATGATLGRPFGVAVDAAGNVYIADTDNHRIRKVAASGIITTIAGTGQESEGGDGGPALAAGVLAPFDVEARPDGSIYLNGWNTIRRISPGGIIDRIAGTAGVEGFAGDGGPARLATLASPDSMGFDAYGNLYVLDSFNHRVRRISPGGTITTVAGTGEDSGVPGDGDDGPAIDAWIWQPIGLAVAASGRYFLGDYGHSRVREVAAPSAVERLGDMQRTLDRENLRSKANAPAFHLRQARRLLDDGNAANDVLACGALQRFESSVEGMVATGRIGEPAGLDMVLWSEVLRSDIAPCVAPQRARRQGA